MWRKTLERVHQDGGLSLGVEDEERGLWVIVSHVFSRLGCSAYTLCGTVIDREEHLVDFDSLLFDVTYHSFADAEEELIRIINCN